ncbi:MAG: hypothetical protein ACRDT6_16755 [Micromonosporaceae bacterium]
MPQQPPILGRPAGAPPPSDPDPQAGHAPGGALPDAPAWPPPEQPPEPAEADLRSTRSTLLVAGGVALASLAVCNGVLLWVYDHSSLGVVITLGIFIATVSLAWLRNKGRQLTAVVVGLQALMAASIVVGAIVTARSDLPTGILAGGITLAGLVLLSLIGFHYYTGERRQRDTAIALGTAVAVALTMIGGYVYLARDHERTTDAANAPYVAPPEESVHFLIKQGQDFHNDGAAPAAAKRAFNDFVCPTAREEIAALFASLVRPGEQRLATPEKVTVTERGKEGDVETVTITATIHVIDDLNGSIIQGPETWTFHLEKANTDNYWKVCKIDHPT